MNKPSHKACGLARALSKLGFCSRSQAFELIKAGEVAVNGIIRRDPESRVFLNIDRLKVGQKALEPVEKIYLMLNKPRGLVTTLLDEQGRDTVFKCFSDSQMPFISPVGRLDKASEGLLLFTNDTEWAAGITDPSRQLEKTYHVQINCISDSRLLSQLTGGVVQAGEELNALRAAVLRVGVKNSWLEIVLDEGKNRHIRRLLEVFEIQVLRLVRVAIGSLALGELQKGRFRRLTDREIRTLQIGSSSP